MLRLVPGIIYMVAHFYYFSILTTEYFLTQEFKVTLVVSEVFSWESFHPICRRSPSAGNISTPFYGIGSFYSDIKLVG